MRPSVSLGAQEKVLIDTLFPEHAEFVWRELHALIRQNPGQLDFGGIHDSQALAAYWIGRCSGQAEKVQIGAARAFQIRPAPAWMDWARQAMELICQHYGLSCCVHIQRGELWGVHPLWEGLWAQAMMVPYPSPLAHRLRGRLCGIPADQIDASYHLREGTGVHAEPGA